MLDEVKKVIAEILDVNPSDLSENTATGDISTWDSFRQVMIAVALEERFNIQFDPTEIMTMKNIHDIVITIDKHTKA